MHVSFETVVLLLEFIVINNCFDLAAEVASAHIGCAQGVHRVGLLSIESRRVVYLTVLRHEPVAHDLQHLDDQPCFGCDEHLVFLFGLVGFDHELGRGEDRAVIQMFFEESEHMLKERALVCLRGNLMFLDEAGDLGCAVEEKVVKD